MTLQQCMAGHSERELRIWLAWLNLQWNRPDRHDHYMMQAALEALRGRLKKPGDASMKDMVLRFEDRPAADTKPVAEPPTPGMPRRLTKEDIIKIEKARRMREMGLKQE